MDPLSVIPSRTSRRSYTSQAVEPESLDKIKHLLEESTTGPLGSKLAFQLVTRNAGSSLRMKLGTYGFIQGATHFVVGKVLPGRDRFLDYGYTLEKLILQFTDMGLGTCWLGGTFDRSEFARAIQLPEGHVIPAITPIGYATSSRSVGDRVIRAGAGSRKRKDWEEIFFHATTLAPFHPDEGGEYTPWLDMLRIAPSASNNQPWRVLVAENRFDLYLSRKPGYQKMFGEVDLQMVDMGIAMCHLDLMAKREQRVPKWIRKEDPATIFDWEYVISAKI